MKEQLHYLLEKLITQNDIRLNHEELKLQLLSHPSYPSLHALTGVLRHFQIDNVALRVPVDASTLTQLPACFIAEVDFAGEGQLALIERKNNQVKITFSEKVQEVVEDSAFLSKWGGVLLAIEKSESVKTPQTAAIAPVFQWLLPFFLVLAGSYFIFPKLTLFAGIHFLLSILGWGLSILIVQHDLGMSSGLVNHFCQLSERTSCDAVLQSRGATVWKQIKLSDLSIMVFATYTINWLLVFFSGIGNELLLASLAILAIPFVGYSVYYQARMVKKWCPLCLGIAGILSLQFLLVLLTKVPFTLPLIDLEGGLLLLISLLLVVGIWYPLKTLLAHKVQSDQLSIKYLQLKRNFSVFHTLLEQGSTWQTPLTLVENELILGRPDAPLDLVLITNPLCYYCKQSHENIEQLLAHYPDQIKVIIRFNVNLTDPKNLDYQVAAQLLQIHATGGQQSSRKALKTVYGESVELKVWLAQQEGVAVDPIVGQQLHHYKKWCQDNGINFTPAFYVKQKSFPVAYDQMDLLYFIEELIELRETEILQAVDNFLPYHR
ncbi:MAG: vitamin K epoxide reductase family protein [Bacteroidota bacterium]